MSASSVKAYQTGCTPRDSRRAQRRHQHYQRTHGCKTRQQRQKCMNYDHSFLSSLG
jgi:hypothetical protein